MAVCLVGSELSTRSRQPGSAYAHFLEVLSVCHTVVVETDDLTGDQSYQVGTQRGVTMGHPPAQSSLY